MCLKKGIFVTLILTALCSYCFSEEEDSYDDLPVTYEESLTGDVYQEDDIETINENKFENFARDFTKTTLDTFSEYEISDLVTFNTFGKSKRQEIIFVKNNEINDMYGFGTNITAGFYYTLFNEKARKQIISAAEQYFSDFDNKKLERNSSKTEKKYGSAKLRVIWGPMKKQVKNIGNCYALLGYKFKEKSPYFTITCPEFENENYPINMDVYPMHSSYTQYYFTKAQLKRLITFLSEENIASIN